MNDSKNSASIPPLAAPVGNGLVAGAAKNAGAALAVAGGAGEGKAAPVVQPVSPSAQSPAAFGGHRGGGKKREDGLVAGSESAKNEDKKFNALRMGITREVERRAKGNGSPDFENDFRSRVEELLPPNRAALLDKLAELQPLAANSPPPLSSKKSPGDGSPAPLGFVEPAFAAAVDVPAGGAALVPMFALWSHKMLERPVKLLTRIVDRLRVAKLMEKIRGLGFDKPTEDEFEKRLAYKEQQVTDFNSALTNCSVIELNKRRVGGAQNSHWLELAMMTGELVNCHLDNMDFIEKKLLEKAERENLAGKN